MAGELNTAHFNARRACPVCGGDAVLIYSCPLTADPVRGFIASHYESQGRIDWRLLAGTDFDVMQCGHCDLIYQRHVPNDAVLHHVYNEMIEPAFLEKLEQERLTVDNFHHIAGEMAVLFRLAGKPPGETSVLDFGYGHGRWARIARAMGAKVFVTETGDEKKAAAAALGLEVISDADIDHMRFDIVHSEQVLEHVLEPGRDFARLAAVTGGILKVSVPPRGKLAALLARRGMPPLSAMGRRPTADDLAFNAIHPLEHLNSFSPRTFAWLAAHNKVALIGTVRRRAVAVEMESPLLFARSLARLGIALAKRLVRPDLGYYLYRPVR